jgi:hypothetical protein
MAQTVSKRLKIFNLLVKPGKIKSSGGSHQDFGLMPKMGAFPKIVSVPPN